MLSTVNIPKFLDELSPFLSHDHSAITSFGQTSSAPRNDNLISFVRRSNDAISRIFDELNIIINVYEAKISDIEMRMEEEEDIISEYDRLEELHRNNSQNL